MRRDAALIDLVASVVDGGTPDWAALVRTARSPEERLALEQLRIVAGVAAVHGSMPPGTDETGPVAAAGTALTAVASPPRAAANARETWGHFALYECIGEGSYGRVYRAWDTRLQRQVAIKLLKVGPRRTESTGPNGLLLEAQTLASVVHENVVAIHSVEQHDGRIGLCMEFIEGQTLEQHLERSDAHRSQRRTHLSDHRPDLPERFMRAVERALDPDPARRFQTAGAMRSALADALEDLSASTTRHVTPPAPERRAQTLLHPAVVPARRRWWLPATAVVVVALAIGALWWMQRWRAAPASPETHRIAVIPLRNLTGGPDWQVDAATEDLMGAIARVPGVLVTDWRSAARFAQRMEPATPQIARDLKVGWVVEGSLRRASIGGDLRLSISLFDSAGTQRWSQTYVSPDPTLAEAHAWTGNVRLMYEWDWGQAEAAYRRALDLNPSLVDARIRYAYLLAALGRTAEGLAEARLAQDVDPLFPHLGDVAMLLLYDRQYEPAIRLFRERIDQEPNQAARRYSLARALAAVGRDDEALVELRRAIAAAGGTGSAPVYDAELARLLARRGAPEGRRLLEEVERLASDDTPNLLAYIGYIHVALGNVTQAFEYLDRAADGRAGSLIWAAVDERLDPVRRDPRYARLEARLDIPR